jgi:hypothetical protein
MVRTYATEAWGNATFSLYAATVGPEQWIRFDNATLARTPGAAIQGTECLEPGSAPALIPAIESGAGGGAPDPVRDSLVLDGARHAPAAGVDRRGAHRLTDAIDLTRATSARLTFESWLSSQGGSEGEVQVSTDGVNWMSVALVPASDDWSRVEVDLGEFAGRVIAIRFTLEEGTSAVGVAPDSWRIADPRVEINPAPGARDL